MTSISSLSSSSSSPYTLGLDKNGDGVISADELAAAGLNSKPQTRTSMLSSDSDDSDSGPDAGSKLAAMMMQILMQMTSGETTAPADDDSSASTDDKPPAPPSIDSLDTDGDGVVSAAEFATGKPDNVTDDMSAKLFQRLDKDGNGTLDATELQAADRKRPAPPSVESLDTDGDGVVSATEFAAAKPDDVTDDMSAKFFQRLDKDGNGTLDATELQAMNHHHGKGPQSASETQAPGSQDGVSKELDDLLAQIQNVAKQYLDQMNDDSTSSTTLMTF